MTVRSFWFRDESFNVTGEGYQAEGRIEAPAAQGKQMPVQPVDLAPLLVPLVAFVMISIGARHLTELSRQRPSRAFAHIIIVLFALIGVWVVLAALKVL